jgi:hypothetical protein
VSVPTKIFFILRTPPFSEAHGTRPTGPFDPAATQDVGVAAPPRW